jgi:hypothetical protein
VSHIRDRGHASNFSAAIDDHRSFLRRQKEAERIASERIEAGGNESGGACGKDLSLKGTLHIDASKVQSSCGEHEVVRGLLRLFCVFLRGAPAFCAPISWGMADVKIPHPATRGAYNHAGIRHSHRHAYCRCHPRLWRIIH